MGRQKDLATTTTTASIPNNNTNNPSNNDEGSTVPWKMKVTVCFGNVRVIVPCPNQEMLVRDLIHQATLRYKKATGKSPDSMVVVHKVKSQTDGAIFDPDDRLIDVADDREQIMAIYEEDNDGLPSLIHNAGDGTSASSVGTNSPEPNMFQGNERKFQPYGQNDIEITGEELNNGQASGFSSNGGVVLQVRRGSEPALNCLSPDELSPASADQSKRWSAAPVVDEEAGDTKDSTSRSDYGQNSTVYVVNSQHKENSVIYNSLSNNAVNQTQQISNDSSSNKTGRHLVESKSATQLSVSSKSSNGIPYRTQDSLMPSKFSRENNRLSMQISGEFGNKWADAADRALISSSIRKEPVGAHASPNDYASAGFFEGRTNNIMLNNCNESLQEILTELVLPYDLGPLGIHLIPFHTKNARNQGLIIQGIERGGRIDRDGRLEAGDKIVEINGVSVINVPFQHAQELLRERLNNPELKLKIVKQNSNCQLSSNNVQNLVSKFNGDLEEKENLLQSLSEKTVVGDARIATVSPTKKTPLQVQAVPLVRPATTLIASNTRKIGRKYEISLQKGAQGLGFSITTRDNPAGGNCPIYIKNILPTGAAIDDGRLRPGDRLLEVNSIEITGKSQSEAVSILRNVPLGGVVHLIVSRQERVDLSPKLPRQIPPEKMNEDTPSVPWSEREVTTLDIPVLDTEKAGLGISVKGKTTVAERGNMVDMGIFIKSVIHGGAASRDGRLKPNDQLLNINGISLLDRSNTDAMETLRRTMTQDGPKPKPGFITLVIARRVASSSAPNTDISACGSSASGDEMDSWGSKNISLSADGSRLAETLMQQSESNTTHVDVTSFQNGQFLPVYTADVQYSSLGNSDKGMPEINQSQHIGKEQQQPLNLPRNPVLERLTSGKSNNQAMRNESYYRATNETRNAINSRQNKSESSTVQNLKGEMILYESDYSPPSKPPRRSRSSTPENGLGSNEDEQYNKIPHSPQVDVPLASDVTYASQTSLEDEAGFILSRDAFGRQSMSEKRHATLDAKNTDTYQRNKKLKEERERQRELQLQQEGLNQQKRAEQLARERNLQDELARRGIKRPFNSSTEDELNNHVPVVQVSPSARSFQQERLRPNESRTFTEISPIGRRGLGDHFKQLLHHLGNKQIHSPEEVGPPRVNSADSLVEILKQQQSPAEKQQRPQNSRKAVELSFKGSNRDIGPSLGMKKSSSLESLQTMVQEIQIQEDVISGYGPARSAQVRVVRGRGCNESFRQAVDRSYEAPLGELGAQMETLAEEEAESCISGPASNYGHQMGRSGPSTRSTEPIYGKRPAPKKKGLFKGLGSMFRFGRHRKSSQGSLSAGEIRKQQAEIERMDREDSELAERDRARQVAYAEQMRIQEQYRRLVEKQKQVNPQYGHGQPDPTYGMTVSISNKSGSNYSSGGLPKNSQHFHNNNQSQLRPQFRKSMDVQSIRDRERERNTRDINGNPATPSSGTGPSHLRSSSYDMYNEMTRPGSRVGVVVEPKTYSHYINYDEIRHHLNDNCRTAQINKLSEMQIRQMRNTVMEQRKKAILESRRHQQHYHSQRREHPRERQERPMSNFYEYESVQATLNSSGTPKNKHNFNYAHQSNNNNNNGVTLPSPSTTFPGSHHHQHPQMPPSQFQAVPAPSSASANHHNKHIISQLNQSSSSTLQHIQSNSKQQIQQQPRPNSLPRRSQRDLAKSPQHTAMLSNTNHWHPSPPAGDNGRYVVYPNQQNLIHIQRNSHTHLVEAPAPSSSSSRILNQNNFHNNNHNHPQNSQMYRNPTTTSLGSKV